MPIQMIMILGPTGVGKSDFAMQLAQAIGGEIINCDMGQFYAPLTIGTAKPAWQSHPVPHHLFDVLTEPIHYCAASYRDAVALLLSDISARGNVPVVVGGSGFYATSLLYSFASSVTDASRDQAAVLYADNTIEQSSSLWEKLQCIDPVRARAIHPHDTYRIERALAIWQKTGKIPSQQAPLYNPLCSSYRVIHMTRDRQELYQRINMRTHSMIESGWIEEVAGLNASWQSFVSGKGILGYKELLTYGSDSSHDTQTIVESVQRKTRNYAKRQLSYWRKLKSQLELVNPGCTYELNLTLSDVALYIKQLEKECSDLDGMA